MPWRTADKVEKECGQFRVYTEKPKKMSPAWLGQARHAMQIAGSRSFQTERGTSAKVLRSRCQESRRNSTEANRAEMGTQG